MDHQVSLSGESQERDQADSEIKAMLDMKRSFLEWILSFGIYSTYSGATYQRKESALALLSHFLESERKWKKSLLFEFRVKSSPFEVSMNSKNVIEALITTLVHDKYNSTRIAAFELLRDIEGELVGYDVKQVTDLATSLVWCLLICCYFSSKTERLGYMLRSQEKDIVKQSQERS